MNHHIYFNTQDAKPPSDKAWMILIALFVLYFALRVIVG